MTTLSELNDYVYVAEQAARAASEVQLRYFRTNAPAEKKSDNSLVSQADRETEAAIRAVIRENCPHHGIFGEEEAAENEAAHIQWIIDPIDGTHPFLAGYPTFTSLIAVAEGGVPRLGLINQPYTKECYIGDGKTALLNNKPVHVRPCKSLESATLVTTSPDYFTEQTFAQFSRIKARAGNSLYGGDAYAYAMLAAGHVDVVMDADLKPYDYAALIPVIQGAGGIVSDWQGNPVTVDGNKNIVAAGDAAIHAEIIKRLNHE